MDERVGTAAFHVTGHVDDIDIEIEAAWDACDSTTLRANAMGRQGQLVHLEIAMGGEAWRSFGEIVTALSRLVSQHADELRAAVGTGAGR
jgi:hypothetical protein